MSWFCSNSSSKHLFVKIVHPGGHVELHDRPILAADLLRRNPKCCVAHPTVFHHPHAVLSPETTLLLGKKYYVVPLGTIRKLQLERRHRAARIGGKGGGAGDGDSFSSCWFFRNGKNGEMREKNDDILRTKMGAAGSESSVEETSEVMMGGGGSSTASSPGRISLVSMDNWQPGLHSICEEY